MYCNSCLKLIPKEKVTHCTQCGVPLCKDCANHCMTCGKELCDTCYVENNFRCEDCFKPENMFTVIRRSHLEQYAGCPYSLYLQLVNGITPPMGKHAQLGVIVHELIEQISEGMYSLQEAEVLLDERIVDWNMSTDDEYSIITMELEEVGHNCLKAFDLIKDQVTSNKMESEYNIKYSIDDNLPMISCTLDRIRWDTDNNIHIHDWKTGKPMSGKRLIEDLQPPLYIYAVYKEFGTLPKTFTLHYLNHDKHLTYKQVEGMHYEVTTSRNTYILDIEEALARTKKILEGIKNNKFKIPKDVHNYRCDKLCWFGISGKCAGSMKESWKKLTEQYNEGETI